jgi:hypothetical protein
MPIQADADVVSETSTAAVVIRMRFMWFRLSVAGLRFVQQVPAQGLVPRVLPFFPDHRNKPLIEILCPGCQTLEEYPDEYQIAC